MYYISMIHYKKTFLKFTFLFVHLLSIIAASSITYVTPQCNLIYCTIYAKFLITYKTLCIFLY